LTEHDDVIKHCSGGGGPRLSLALGPAAARAGPANDNVIHIEIEYIETPLREINQFPVDKRGNFAQPRKRMWFPKNDCCTGACRGGERGNDSGIRGKGIQKVKLQK